MMKHLPTVAMLPGGIESRPMTESEFVALRDAAIRGFAASTVRSGLLSPSDAMKRSVTQFGDLPAAALATKDNSFVRLYAGSDPVAGIWLAHHSEPNTSFVCHVEVDEAHRGHGYGRAAMAIAEQASINAGDTNLGLSVFGHNTIAISLYAGMGYEVVEQGRSNAAA
jgi:ribosomal protein S18 acetylase RimI-like enzyme